MANGSDNGPRCGDYRGACHSFAESIVQGRPLSQTVPVLASRVLLLPLRCRHFLPLFFRFVERSLDRVYADLAKVCSKPMDQQGPVYKAMVLDFKEQYLEMREVNKDLKLH